MHHRITRRAVVAALALGVAAGTAHAQTGLDGLFPAAQARLPMPAAVAAVAALSDPAASHPAGGAAAALDDASLAQLRGGTATADSGPAAAPLNAQWNAPWSDMKLNGTVGNNTASNVVTGANIVTNGAFSNASGLPMVIQNSGANVLIQSATIVNVQFR